MNLYAYGALALALMVAVSWGAVERGNANSWHGKYDSLKASYQEAAIKAEQDAKAQEAKAAAENQRRADLAVTQAYAAQTHAEAIRATYTAKLSALSKQSKLDLGHQCAFTPVPPELLP